MGSVTTDHDLLITLVEKVSNLQADIKQYTDNTATQIADHETRLRTMEQAYVSWPKALTALTTMGVVMSGLWWVVR